MSDYLKSRNRNQFVNGLPKENESVFHRILGELEIVRLSNSLSVEARLTHVEALGASRQLKDVKIHHVNILPLQASKIGGSKIYTQYGL